MSELALGVATFTLIVSCLVLLVLGARAVLNPTGDVALELNERTLRVPLGEKLLEGLARNHVYLPSACGGKGTCAQCVVSVLSGGGEALLTERARLTPAEVARGSRLACQLTVREPLRVRVPDEVLGVQTWRCRVRSAQAVGTLLRELVLELPAGESLDHRAGAYVQVTSPPFRQAFSDLPLEPDVRLEWERLRLLELVAECRVPTTRAYSLANHPGEAGIAQLIVRIALPPPAAREGTPPGVVSSYLFGLEVGAEVQLAGPFGHFFAADGEREMVFVGGGAGMAPMRAHIFDQLELRGAKRPISFWYGARSRRELFYVEDFEQLARDHPNFRWTAALSEPRAEDRWEGEVGFIHDVLYRRYLAEHPAPEDCEYYLCGPPVMLRATRSLLDGLGVAPEDVHYDDFGSAP